MVRNRNTTVGMEKIMGKPASKLYEKVTARIVAALEKGTLPWRRTWKQGNGAAYGFPHNAVTGRPYRGINVWLLMMAAEDRGFTSTGWITPNKCKEFDLDFKGASPEWVVFWNRSSRTDEETGETKTFMWAKGYQVINLDEVRGDLSKLKGHKALEIPEEISDVDDLCVAMQDALDIEVKHGGDRAYYQPTRDFIGMPPQDAFDGTDEYRATLFHEGTHSTGHKSRCDRDLKGRFGTEAYAFEELIAELGSAYIGAALGINMDMPNHASYLASWLKVLKGDEKAIFTAASKAQQAVDYLFDRLSIAEAPVYEQKEAA
jgi:antirestriction protein ArdC